jgi:hypothetical protein
MITPLPLLLAAGFQEIVSVLVGLAFFVIWVINQINDAKKKQAAPPQPRADMPPPPAGQAAVGVAPPADPLRAQVDDFLRRAGKQPPRKATSRDEVVVLLDDSAAAPQRTTLADKMKAKGEAAAARRAKPTPSQSPRPSKSRPPQAKLAPPKPRPTTLAQQVASHIGSASEDFRQEVADLGQRVKQADEQFDRDLQKKFDHDLGSLSHRPTAAESSPSPTTEPKSPAAQIAALLASPGGVRQAIILNEIMQRPADRW